MHTASKVCVIGYTLVGKLFQTTNPIGESVRINPSGPLIASSPELEISAAAAGLGMIASFEGFLAPAIGSGALEEVLEDWSPRFSGPFLYYASRRHMPPPLRAFIDYIKQHAAKETP